MTGLRERIARLAEDRRGSVALAPVFIIIAIAIAGTIVASLLTAQTATTRSAQQQSLSAAARSAVTAVTAELNTRALEEIITAGAYQPVAWIPRAGETVQVVTVDQPAADVVRVTFDVDTVSNKSDAWSFTVEYRAVPVIQEDGEWVPADTATPERTLWTPAQSLTEEPE